MKRAIVLLAGLLAGCSFGEWGRDFGTGTIEGLGSKADSLGARVVAGAADTLTAAGTRRRLDSLINDLGLALSRQAGNARDTLLGAYTRGLILALKDSLLGAGSRKEVAALRNELLGAGTEQQLSRLRDALVGDTTLLRAAALRNDLLGPATGAAVQALVDSAMSSLIRRYRNDLAPELQSELSFLQRNAAGLIGLVAALALAVIAFVWWQKRKYRELVALLANSIHEIPDQKSYDDLTRSVQRRAQERGYEPLLRKTLAAQGLDAPWRPAGAGR